MRQAQWPEQWPELWPEQWPIFLPFLPGFSFCVGEHLGEGGDFEALKVPAAAASMAQWPELWPRGSAGRVLPFLPRFHAEGLV